MIDVTVKVPVERVPEFYSMFGLWLSSPGVASPPPSEAVEQEFPEWTAGDGDLACAVWAKFTDTAQGLFSILMDSPGERLSGDQLATALGLSNGQHGVAGVLGWPGRHCFAAGRSLPWSWEYPDDGAGARYWFEPDKAELFRKARGQ